MAKKPTYEELEQWAKGLEKEAIKRKQAEEALQESEARFQLLYERAPLGYQSLDEDGKFIEVNPAWLNILGYSREEVIRESFSEFLHPDWKDHFKENFSRFKAIGEILGVEFEMVKKDGSFILVSFTGKIGKEKDGGFKQTHCILQDITKRKQAEEQMRENEEKFRSFMDSATDGFILFDSELNYIEMNKSALEMTGLSKNDVIGKNIIDVVPNIKASGRYEEYQQVIKTGVPFLIPDFIPQPKFGRKYIELKAFKVKNGLGIILTDITERKWVEQRKALNIRILDTINKFEAWKDCIEEILGEIKQFTGFEAIAIRLSENEDFPYYVTKGFPAHFVEAERYLCTRDSKGEIERDSKGNPYLECMCGNVICGRTDASKDFFTERGSFWSNNTSKLLSETTDEERQTRTRNRCNGEGYESVALFPLKAGHEILGLLQINDTKPHQFTDDTIRFFEDIGISIGTAFSRKRAKDALRVSEEKFRITLKNSPIVVWSQDKGLRYTWIHNPNPDFDIEGVIGKTDEELLPFDEAKRLTEIKRNVLKSGLGTREEVITTINGEQYFFDLSVEPLIDLKGDVVGITCVSTDLTDSKKAEEEKRKLEGQLQQAYKMEAIGTLTGGVAHDFNNILSIIIGNTELALDDIPKGNPVYFCLKDIKTASLRAADIVKQLLSFTRKTEHKLRPIQIVPVIKDAIKFLRSTIPSNIKFKENISAEDITVLTDPVQIHQVIMNLCINAYHEMEETGGTLEITVGKEVLDDEAAESYPGLTKGDYAKIMVSDTGSGIDSTISDKIFDPYFTTKEIGKGSGLGLAVVHGIIKNHSGAITLDSQPGKGTTFTILFSVAYEKPNVKTETSNAISLGSETILFVDDEKSIATMGGRMLERLGYQVETRTNPLEAVELFQSKPDQFDLVITDMAMPQMTGAQLSEKLIAIRSDIPIIICTGHSSLVDGEKAKEMGAAAYVMKPIVKQEMAKTIRKVLDK